MGDTPDTAALLGVFLDEATDGLAKVWNAMQADGDTRPSVAALKDQYIVAHRTRGTAGLYEFPEMARLAERLERLLDRPSDALQARWSETVTMLRDLVATLKLHVECIRDRGVEAPEQIGAWYERYAALLELADANGAGTERGEPMPATVSDDYLRPPLGSEVLSYLVPEAHEYL